MYKMPVYVATTKDKYELPLAVADTAWALARMLGVTEIAVARGVKYTERGRRGKYHKVWIELTDEEWDEQRRVVLAAKERAGMV